jgi:hypothetical protein
MPAVLFGLACRLGRFSVRFLRLLEGAAGVIERLFGKLVRIEVVLVAMMRGGNPVRMSGLLVHFSGDSVRVSGHVCLLDQLTSLVPAGHAATAQDPRPGGPATGQRSVCRDPE